MNKIFKYLPIIVFLTLWRTATAQEILHPDTLQAPIIGFSFGVTAPSDKLSFGKDPDGNKVTDGSMYDLYKPPYLSFGLDFAYKLKSNWFFSFDGSIFFGSDNLKYRVDRMSGIFTRDSIIVGTNGTDAVVTCYNRGLTFKGGVGKLFPFSDKNPNSGIFAKLSGGYIQNQTIFMINEVNAPQIDDDYALLYDHQRRGFVLTESIGYLFMSNHRTLVNAYIALEVSQSWMHSTRDYIIDNMMGLHGPDPNRYFDMSYAIKLCWMFPLTGKPAYDYYYF